MCASEALCTCAAAMVATFLQTPATLSSVSEQSDLRARFVPHRGDASSPQPPFMVKCPVQQGSSAAVAGEHSRSLCCTPLLAEEVACVARPADHAVPVTGSRRGCKKLPTGWLCCERAFSRCFDCLTVSVSPEVHRGLPLCREAQFLGGAHSACRWRERHCPAVVKCDGTHRSASLLCAL